MTAGRRRRIAAQTARSGPRSPGSAPNSASSGQAAGRPTRHRPSCSTAASGGCSLAAATPMRYGAPDCLGCHGRPGDAPAACETRVVAVLDTGIIAPPRAGRQACCRATTWSATSSSQRRRRPRRRSDRPGRLGQRGRPARRPGAFAGCDAERQLVARHRRSPACWRPTPTTQGVAAINWHGRVVPVRVAGKCGAEVADIVDGMRWAAGLEVLGDGVPGCRATRIRCA